MTRHGVSDGDRTRSPRSHSARTTRQRKPAAAKLTAARLIGAVNAVLKSADRMRARLAVSA